MLAAHRRAFVTFGTFEVDLDSGEIRKAGRRVRLQGQPFRVLATLLSKAGEVVSREDLQHEIWGDNTTIDFERGIASAVNKIREALGDSAESPRYIETLAKRGYRFIAPVVVEEVTALTIDEPKPVPLTAAPEIVDEQRIAISQALPLPVSAQMVPPQDAPRLESSSPSLEVSRPTRLRLSRRTVLLLTMTGVVLMSVASWSTYLLLQRSQATLRPPAHSADRDFRCYLQRGRATIENPPRLVSDGVRLYASFLIKGSVATGLCKPGRLAGPAYPLAG